MTSSLPGDFPRYTEYEQSFVAFLDILGFSKRVRGIRNEFDFQNTARVLYAIKKEAESWTNATESFAKDVQMTAMSDSIVVTIPYRNAVALYFTVSIIRKLQHAMISDSDHVLLRGYIAEGKTYHAHNLLFGPGYLNAYEGESALGGPPRIVLDPTIAARAVELTLKAHGDGRHSVLDLLRRDSDGRFFVDYLKPSGPGADQVGKLAAIAAFVREEVANEDTSPEVRAKFQWLVGYLDTVRREISGYVPPADAAGAKSSEGEKTSRP